MYRTLREAKVEDPLEDLLNLARETKSRMSQIRFLTMFGLVGGFLASTVLWTFLAVRLFLGSPEIADLYITGGALASSGAVLVAVKTGRFLLYFESRLGAIESFVEFNPHPEMPPGADPVLRALDWLRSVNRKSDRFLTRHLKKLTLNTEPRGSSGYGFSAYAIRRSLWLPLQYQLFVKVFEHPVRIADLQELKGAVERVLARAKTPPSYVLAIQTAHSEIPEDVERWIDDNWVLYPTGRKPGRELHACPVQLIVEREDGKYEVACVFAG